MPPKRTHRRQPVALSIAAEAVPKRTRSRQAGSREKYPKYESEDIVRVSPMTPTKFISVKDAVGAARTPFDSKKPGANFPADDTLRPHNEHYIDKLYDSAKDLIASLNGQSNNMLSDLTVFCKELMVVVKSYPGLLGPEKKIIVLRVIQRVVDEMKLTGDMATAANSAINYVLPSVIDLLILASEGKIDFGQKWKSVKKAWNSFVGLCCCGGCRTKCVCSD